MTDPTGDALRKFTECVEAFTENAKKPTFAEGESFSEEHMDAIRRASPTNVTLSEWSVNDHTIIEGHRISGDVVNLSGIRVMMKDDLKAMIAETILHTGIVYQVEYDHGISDPAFYAFGRDCSQEFPLNDLVAAIVAKLSSEGLI